MMFTQREMELQEAAEFEARVAAKLADPQFRHCSSSNSCYVEKRPFMMDCKDCRMHDAYLAVEGEMECTA